MGTSVNLRVGWSRGWRLAPRSPTQFLADQAPIWSRRGLQPIWALARAGHVSPPCWGMRLAAKTRGVAARMHQASVVSDEQITDAEGHQLLNCSNEMP